MSRKKDATPTYEKIAQWYDEVRSKELFERSIFDRVLEKLPPKASVLDIGCGMGEPIGTYLIGKGYAYTGIDNNMELLELALDRHPNSTFFRSDMRSMDMGLKFDLLIAWNSYFHLTQNEQRAMFPIFVKHANPGAHLLFTTGSQEGEVWSNNGGHTLYHASLDPDEYKLLLQEHGFSIIDYELEDKSCHGTSWWWAALK